MFLQYINVAIVVLVVQINVCSSFRLAKLKHNVFSVRLDVQTNGNIHVETYDDPKKRNITVNGFLQPPFNVSSIMDVISYVFDNNTESYDGPDKPNISSDNINEYCELEIKSINITSVVDIDDNIMEIYNDIQQSNDDINVVMSEHEFDECSTGGNEHEFQVPTTTSHNSIQSAIGEDYDFSGFETADSDTKTDRDLIIKANVEDAYDEIKLNNDDDLDITTTKEINLLIDLSKEMISNFRNCFDVLRELQYTINNTTELTKAAINMTKMNIDVAKLLVQEVYGCSTNITKLKSLTFVLVKKIRLAEEKIWNNTLEIRNLKAQLLEFNEMKTTMNNMQEELCDMKYKLAFMNEASTSNTTAISTNATAMNNKTTATAADFVHHHSSLKMALTLFLLTLTSVLQPEIRSGVRFIINRIKSIRLK